MIGNEGEVIASSKKQIDSGGTAVVAIKNHKKRPYLSENFSKSSEITISEVESQEPGIPGRFLLIAVYINPGSSEMAKLAR